MSPALSKLLSFTGIIGLVLGHHTAKAETYSSDNNPMTKRITEVLVEKGIVAIDAQSDTLQIDTCALLRLLSKDIDAKLRQSNNTLSEKEMYERLQENIRSGNFERRYRGSKELQSMDFSKASN